MLDFVLYSSLLLGVLSLYIGVGVALHECFSCFFKRRNYRKSLEDQIELLYEALDE